MCSFWLAPNVRLFFFLLGGSHVLNLDSFQPARLLSWSLFFVLFLHVPPSVSRRFAAIPFGMSTRLYIMMSIGCLCW